MIPFSRPKFLLYLRVSSNIAIVCIALELVICLMDPHRGSWQSAVIQAVVMGTVLGLGLGMFAARAALKGLDGKDWQPGDVTWFARRQWTEVELPFGLAESLSLIEAELRAQPEIDEVRIHPGRPVVRARARNSLQRMGDRLTVTCQGVGAPDAATTRARIESRPVLCIRVIDGGTSKRNVEAVARLLNQAVNKRLKAEHAAAEEAALRAELQHARLALLQAQVEPHFLYNTLASLQLLVRDDPPAAQKMTGDLIRYLRLSVADFRAHDFRLGQEMDLVRAYVDIMKIRMGSRLCVDFAVDEEAAARPFAPLLVHTLVENAIKHGLEPRPEGGRIAIEAHAAPGGTLRIVVADTGLGLQTERQGSGLGLANLRERLALLYGERARFTFAPNAPTGVVCTMEIPAMAGAPA